MGKPGADAWKAQCMAKTPKHFQKAFTVVVPGGTWTSSIQNLVVPVSIYLKS